MPKIDIKSLPLPLVVGYVLSFGIMGLWVGVNAARLAALVVAEPAVQFVLGLVAGLASIYVFEIIMFGLLRRIWPMEVKHAQGNGATIHHLNTRKTDERK